MYFIRSIFKFTTGGENDMRKIVYFSINKSTKTTLCMIGLKTFTKYDYSHFVIV